MSRNWIELYRLVKQKKGPMDGEAIENYVREQLDVPDLSFATRDEVLDLVRMLMGMPDKKAA